MKNYLKYGVSAIAIIAMTAFAQAQTNERQEGPQAGTSAHESQSGHEGGNGEGSSVNQRMGQVGSQSSEGTQTQGSVTQEQPSGRGSQSAQTEKQEGKSEHAQEKGTKHQGKSASEQGQAGVSQKSAQERGEHGGSAAQEKSAERSNRSEHQAVNQKENESQQETQKRQSAEINTGGQNARTSTEGSRGGHGARVKINITPVEKTRIHQVIERDSGIRRYSRSDVHFALNVGTRVPDTVVLYSPPPPLISISPAFRDYKIIIVGNILIVVDPDTREIVDVIEV